MQLSFVTVDLLAKLRERERESEAEMDRIHQEQRRVREGSRGEGR